MPYIDDKQLIRSLSREHRQKLTARSDLAGLRHLFLHLACISAGAVYITLALPFYGLVMFPHGVLIVFLFTPLHETIHRTAFRSVWLNHSVAYLCGFLVFLGPRWFRYFHLDHHRYTHNPQRDPELASPKPITRWQYLIYMTGLPEWLARLKSLLVSAFIPNTDSFVPAAKRRVIATEARLLLTGYAILVIISLSLGSTLLVWIWIIPMLLGNPLLRGYLLAEHTGCPHVSNMLENTRTMYSNRLVRFIAWNMPYHIEHHVYPGVPFYQLPAFHEVIKSHLIHTEQGYLRFNKNHYCLLKK